MSDTSPRAGRLDALQIALSELDKWNDSPSTTDSEAEPVPPGHPLHAAVVALEAHYGGRLPRPARSAWKRFLRLSRAEDEASEDEAEQLRQWFDQEIRTAGEADGEREVRDKRSVAPGDARTKLKAALTGHHKVGHDRETLHTEPVGVRKLARDAETSVSSASKFFRTEFGGHTKYQSLCSRDPERLIQALTALNGGYSPWPLYGEAPPGESDPEE